MELFIEIAKYETVLIVGEANRYNTKEKEGHKRQFFRPDVQKKLAHNYRSKFFQYSGVYTSKKYFCQYNFN